LTLTGANPSNVTFPEMVNVGFALLVEAYEQIGVNRIDAIERVELIGMEPTDEEQTMVASLPPREINESQVASENDRSLLALMEMMKGAGGMPG
jgi:hypothetical protein